MKEFDKIPGIGNNILKEMDRIEKQKKVKRLIGVVIGATALYFTISLYDWKLAVIIMAFLWGNNLEQNNK